MSFYVSLFLTTLTSLVFLKAAFVTLSLTILSHSVAILLSVPLALAINGRRPFVRAAAKTYVSVFRALPTLLLLLLVWNALPQMFSIFREPWFSPFIAAFVALALNESAYQVEINRAALSSIQSGQYQAGQALGFRPMQIFCLIICPQAARVALPPTVNEFITLLKTTSLASVISLTELMAITQQSVSATFRYAEFYAVAAVYYLVMVYALTWLQGRVERKFAWADPHGAAASEDRTNSRH